ncbi:hypothetical protein CG723_40695 [Streptomyces sp. CB01635]|uniref:DUF6082 family protein n=1 Tax=unclassified Streptomyces TaxID=2593676 RepID=UPI000C26F42D|nr:DUF6082 family protein [Streptomyces sp. CB01635]PJN06190.1 hypothetical protein CG723_40695 [Streptomyces sp. CB01635]
MTLLVAGTPSILRWAAPRGMDWGELSSISQAYGGLGVLFSGAALIGIVISIRQQNTQARMALVEAQRTAHRETLFEIISNPELIPCTEPLNIGQTETRWKQLLFTNMHVATLRTDYVLGRFSDDHLRVVLELHFRGEIARQHWEISRSTWMAVGAAEGGADARFARLVEAEYARAVQSGSPVPADSYVAPEPEPSSGA